MHFRDRQDAGERLAELLLKFARQEGVVYALPRGGVVPGAIIARRLQMPLEVITARKIGHPMNPEYAIAAVTDTGEIASNSREVMRVDADWFRRAAGAQQQEAQRRYRRFMAGRKPVDVTGKVAILVDDGVATGLTMEAAIRQARQRRPGRLVLAVPVIPDDTAQRLGQLVDEVVALTIDHDYLGAVGAYYGDFHQVTDDEVMALLRGVGADADSGAI